jgi:hypothetical protein
LLPYKPKLELASISENDVNSYGFIQVENNFYSVPEYLVGKKVTVKNYFDEICIYSNNCKVCEHQKLDGFRLFKVDISHYLDTLYKKPGAVRNSVALKSSEKLKAIFDDYYSKKPRRFIEIFMENRDSSTEEIIAIFEEMIKVKAYILAVDVTRSDSVIDVATRHQTSQYNSLCIGGARV